MFRSIIWAGLVIVMASHATIASAKNQPDPVVLSAKDRAGLADVAVSIGVPQIQIASSVDVGRVARPPSGGLLDTLVVYSLDDKAKIMAETLRQKAELTIAPVRQSLSGFDVDTLARSHSEKAVSAVGWISKLSIDFVKNGGGTPDGPGAARIVYRYDMSPDFSSVRLFADISVFGNVSSKSKAAPANALKFRQMVTSIVKLRKTSFEPVDNAEAWAADNGKKVKYALGEAFASMELLLPKALNLSGADVQAFGAKNREQAFAAGNNGALIQRGGTSPDDIVIWNNGLLRLHTIP